MIVNTGDWDSSIGTNAPGQSGNPDSPFYGNLFKDWSEDKYFPVYFLKKKLNCYFTIRPFCLQTSL